MNFPSLHELLPHRPPMLLLGGIVSHEPAQTVCYTFLGADHLVLFGPDHLPSTLAVELVAQTMAVHDGLRRRSEARPPASRGFLLGSRRFELLSSRLPLHEELRVLVSGEDSGAGGLVRFEGRVENARGNVLARGDVTVLEHRPDSA